MGFIPYYADVIISPLPPPNTLTGCLEIYDHRWFATHRSIRASKSLKFNTELCEENAGSEAP